MIEDDEADDQFKYSGPDNAGVAILPPFIYLFFIFIAFVLNAYIGFDLFTWWSQLVIGILIMALGAGVVTAAFIQFSNSGINIKPTQPTANIITDGIYAYTRNPMYLGLTLGYIGLMILCDLVWGLLLSVPLILIIRHYAIAREESYLQEKFGEDYEEYKDTVRRWI